MKRITTTLLDRHRNNLAVDATLIDGVTREQLDQAESLWSQPRLEAALRLSKAGVTVPQHWHWNWAKKSAAINLLSYRCFGIECEGVMQGLMLVCRDTAVAWLKADRGKPLVYVDYLETAPWNVKEMTPQPRFGAVGVRLFEAAVRQSLADGYSGRVGLHSLPQAEPFYESVCGMTRGEVDTNKEDLFWFELTPVAARKFLGGDQS